VTAPAQGSPPGTAPRLPGSPAAHLPTAERTLGAPKSAIPGPQVSVRARGWVGSHGEGWGG